VGRRRKGGGEGGRGGQEGLVLVQEASLHSRPSIAVWPRMAVVICAARSSMPISLPEGHSSSRPRRVLALLVP
jgi:hypothetical protein